ncbi:MAG: hypothetical protein K0S26_2521 [Bacteroidota bacterium]|nr:hypothetical protein [Bacteroidota bacterium]
MKVIFLILSFIFTLFPNNEKLDNCNGIDRFIFGTPKEQFKNITLELEQGNAQLYTNLNGLENEPLLCLSYSRTTKTQPLMFTVNNSL